MVKVGAKGVLMRPLHAQYPQRLVADVGDEIEVVAVYAGIISIRRTRGGRPHPFTRYELVEAGALPPEDDAERERVEELVARGKLPPQAVTWKGGDGQ